MMKELMITVIHTEKVAVILAAGCTIVATSIKMSVKQPMLGPISMHTKTAEQQIIYYKKSPLVLKFRPSCRNDALASRCLLTLLFQDIASCSISQDSLSLAILRLLKWVHKTW
jgi:hypothetical protein